MNPDDFRSQWVASEPADLVTFSREAISGLCIATDSKRLLADVGLPESAAPFLDFGGESAFFLPPVHEVWMEGDGHQRIIGSNGYGDPICVHSQSGVVSFLLHDDGMRAEFMNSSLLQLAYTLLAFRHLVQKTNELGGSDAYLEGRIPMEIADHFIRVVDEIDPDAMKPERFWFTAVVK